MKRLIAIIAIIGGIFLSYQTFPQVRQLLSYSPCNSPLTYKIGTIDSRFGLSRNDVINYTSQAALTWNKTINKSLFSYSPRGKITVNLIYDERQKLSSRLDSIEKQLDTDKNTLKPQIAEYTTRSKDFDRRVASLNQQIDLWNRQGGAPADTYKTLLEEQQQLQQEANELNNLARSLNQSTRDYNTQVNKLYQTENAFNETLSVKPEEGIWNANDNSITIYFNNSRDELIHTLAHELGHALGMDHNTNAESIMYKSSNSKIVPSEEDIESLAQVCKNRSLGELIIKKYAQFILTVRKKFVPAS